jgi:Protein of unknown function (DUF2934)
MRTGRNFSISMAEAPRLDHDVIAALAFELWKERGCPAGSAEEDWYNAGLNNAGITRKASVSGASLTFFRPWPNSLGKYLK